MSSNPLKHPGAEGQSQRLRALPGLKPETERERRIEGSLTGSPGDAAERTTKENPTERLTGSKRDTTNDGGAGVPQGIRRPAPAAREAPSENSGHA
ncbi:hypothetical protein NDU88_007108 [Pleurodeles waltl]|uniref:Uncharacterized protein n=1 Tax=Pleurodeles waltl TaxID=8319 RepID=A0AAV7QNR0_PLEWA|nr:hypothetical protein NDU88_007108 [Pleurodeles waltl]